jgi:hypothetical protein
MEDTQKENIKIHALQLAHTDLITQYNQTLTIIQYFMATVSPQDQETSMTLLGEFEKTLTNNMPTPEKIVERAEVFYNFLK